MNILYWNTKGKDIVKILKEINKENETNLIILSEYKINDVYFLENINVDIEDKFKLHANLNNDESRIFFRGNIKDIIDKYDTNGMSIKEIFPYIGESFLLVCLHLTSKLYFSDIEQALLSCRLSNDIEEIERHVGHQRTILIGDFNMNPFESGMVAFESFHSISSKKIVKERNTRIVQKKEKKLFYNPMWGLLGDKSYPEGTFYYNKASEICYFWNVFDQVLISPSMIDLFNDNSLKIIDGVKEINLLDERGLPDKDIASDHLPIYFQLKFTLEKQDE